jgi:hypothetical protein
MSLGEKLLLGSVGTQAVGTLIGNPQDTRWQGAFYGTTYKGGGPGPVDMTKIGAPPPTEQPQGEGQPLSAAPSLVGEQAKTQAAKQAQSQDLFSMPKAPTAPTGERKNPKVRYV